MNVDGGPEEERIVFCACVFADLWHVFSFFSYNEEGCIIYASALFRPTRLEHWFSRGGRGTGIYTKRSKREHAELILFSIGVCY